MWRRPRALAAATAGALLMGWGTASALSGPEPVPDSYAGRFVLTYAGQNTEVFKVSGCDLAPAGGRTAVVKPCRFEVPANAASLLKQKIVAALSSGPPSSNTFTLTHYVTNPQDPNGTGVSDYAATGEFAISQVTLPVLDPLDTSADPAFLGVELTPLDRGDGGPDVKPVAGAPVPALPAPKVFQVGTSVAGCSNVRVRPPAVQLSGFTTTLRSLAVSVDAFPSLAIRTGAVRIFEGDSAALQTARGWLAISPPPGQTPTASQLRTLTLTMASYDCATGTSSNELTLSLQVVATSMDPFPRTDGSFTLGIAAALGPTSAPRAVWR
jgi:hypothetical protein